MALGQLRPVGARRVAKRFAREVRDGLANLGTVPLSRQIQLWRHGFYGNHSLLYDFDRFGFDAYLSDLERALRLEAMNDPLQRSLLNDKLVTFLFLRGIGAPTPTVHGLASRGRFVALDPDGPHDLRALLAQEGRLVVKPRAASGGSRFHLLEQVGDETRVDGAPSRHPEAVLERGAIVSGFFEQHAYARAVFPGASNTLRMLALRDAGTGEPFVAAATHRFGTARSQPVDNVGRGGLPAEVDLETGELGALAATPGIHFPGPGRVRWHERHPDTGAQVAGTVVPRWHELVAEVLRVMRTVEGLNCVGWDVGVTADGITILEGNNRPDVIMQVHRPLLADERVERAFREAGIVRRRQRQPVLGARAR